jgi:hypothetical protein
MKYLPSTKKWADQEIEETIHPVTHKDNSLVGFLDPNRETLRALESHLASRAFAHGVDLFEDDEY